MRLKSVVNVRVDGYRADPAAVWPDLAVSGESERRAPIEGHILIQSRSRCDLVALALELPSFIFFLGSDRTGRKRKGDAGEHHNHHPSHSFLPL